MSVSGVDDSDDDDDEDDDDENTHLAVYGVILAGENDDKLNWPFVGRVTITLLNQLENENHFQKELNFEIKDNGLVGENLGFPQYFRNTELAHNPHRNTQYLKDNTLYFRVDTLDHKPWLECTPE